MSLKSSICTQTCQRLDTMAFLLHYNSPSVPCWGCRVVKRKHLSVVCGNSMIEDAGRIHLVESKESIWMTCNISPTWRSPWNMEKKCCTNHLLGSSDATTIPDHLPKLGQKWKKKSAKSPPIRVSFGLHILQHPKGLDQFSIGPPLQSLRSKPLEQSWNSISGLLIWPRIKPPTVSSAEND